MRVQIVDPPAYTPPYDRSLCAALARAGAEVELVTSRFAYGPVPAVDGYRVTEAFHRRSSRLGAGSPLRRPMRALEHVAEMARRRSAAAADVVHYQWLPLPALDAALLARERPLVLTAHGVLRGEAWAPRPSRPLRRLLGRMDAVVTLSDHGRRLLLESAAVGPERVHVIPHGALDYLTRLPAETPLPGELAATGRPVVLCFGLVRPYKGVDVLIEAFHELPDAELWIVGRPLGVDLGQLRELAAPLADRVRFVPRFVPDSELPAYFRRADVVVLPHRDAEQSGVLYAALAFAKPMVMTSVGGFPEVAAHGAGRLVPAGDPGALAAALAALLADPAERERLADAARAAAAGPYSWDRVAEQTMALYRRLAPAEAAA